MNEFLQVSMNFVYQEAFLPATVPGQVETNQAPKNERNGSILAALENLTSDDLEEEIVVPCRHGEIRHRESNLWYLQWRFLVVEGDRKNPSPATQYSLLCDKHLKSIRILTCSFQAFRRSLCRCKSSQCQTFTFTFMRLRIYLRLSALSAWRGTSWVHGKMHWKTPIRRRF